jgi:solute:Na+ symporter, SSS family
MNMALIDWLIVIVFFVFLSGVGVYCRRYVRGVVDFIVAGRGMRKYLGYSAGSIADVGAISVVAFMEAMYKGGPAYLIIQVIEIAFRIVIGKTGFVITRFRETRIMTPPQLFEMRYSKGVRISAGIVCALSGIINMGIFPIVAGRFFTHFAGLPTHFALLGMTLPTVPVLTGVLITTAITFALLGGQVSVIVTDFIQSILISIMFIVLGITAYRAVAWGTISTALLDSKDVNILVNPFANGGSFGLKFLIITIVMRVYGIAAWAPSVQKFSSAASPKDARQIMFLNMGMVFGRAGLFYCGLAAFAIMALPQFSSFGLKEIVAGIDPMIRDQMTGPVLLSRLLPVGLMGLMFAGIMAAFISTNDSYMLSWASIIVQDVICPLRKKAFTRKQHIWVLRIVVILVGIFIYCFGVLYKPGEAILVFQVITGTIYLAGAGTIINFGLYWKRGNKYGAYAAMIVGALTPILNYIFTNVEAMNKLFFAIFKVKYTLGALEAGIIAYLAATVAYIAVSLLTYNPHFDLDMMLNRKNGQSREDK